MSSLMSHSNWLRAPLPYQNLKVISRGSVFWNVQGSVLGITCSWEWAKEPTTCEAIKQGNMSRDWSSLTPNPGHRLLNHCYLLVQSSSQLAAGNLVGGSVPQSCSLKPTLFGLGQCVRLILAWSDFSITHLGGWTSSHGTARDVRLDSFLLPQK